MTQLREPQLHEVFFLMGTNVRIFCEILIFDNFWSFNFF